MRVGTMWRSVVVAGVVLAAGCVGDRARTRVGPGEPMPLGQAMRLIDGRTEWAELPPIDVPRHPAEKYLKDVTIVVDPGHGGTDGGAADTRPTYKTGPTGVKEAFMNLRVALLLERLLTDAGANVILTRRGDDTIGLSERAEVANTAPRPDGGVGADLFISIHHNAVGNPKTNYPSVWYHGEVDDAEPALDAARYVALELGRQMRTDVAVTAPLFSDQLMYPTGFGVLRAARVPAFLLECSFFTNPAEEQRLRDAGYNLREAYAIYLGLCQWAYCGRPTQSPPAVAVEGDRLVVTSTLSDGLPGWWGKDRNRTLRSSVDVTVGGRRAEVEYDAASKVLRASLPADAVLGTGGTEQHTVTIHHANMYANHNYPQRYAVTLGRDAAGKVVTQQVEALGPKRAERPERGATRPATR